MSKKFLDISQAKRLVSNVTEIINNSSTVLNDTQKNAVNSGITSSKVETYEAHISNENVHVTTSDKETWNSKADSNHVHGNITNDGKLGTTANLPVITGTNGEITTGSFGTSANTFCEGNDSRLSDARTPTAHNHSASEITSGTLNASVIPNLDASKITSGTIDIARLPAGALERLVIVADETARFTLTSSNVQSGDVVKQSDTGLMYMVVDESNLNNSAGYVEFTAGTAASVPWSGITNKPSSYTPSSHSHTVSEISDFPSLSTVATSGSYNDLSDKPTIPTVNNATLTIQQNGTTVETFTANASSNVTANITVPTKTSDLDNDSGYITSSDLPEFNSYTKSEIDSLLDDKSDTGHTHTKSDISDFPTLATVATSGDYNDLSNKPTTMTPTSHVHGNITNDGKIGSTANKPLITTTNGEITTGNFGTTANTFCEGNDSRLSDARTPISHNHTTSEISDFPTLATVATSGDYNDLSNKPTTIAPASHTHGNITNDGKIGSTANKPLITTTGGTVTTGSFGTTANTFCEGNDSRLSDARTPTTHGHFASDITSGTLNSDRIPSLDASKIASGTLDSARIPSLDASKITSGTIDIARLPAGALERLVIVADETARFALTTSTVQVGDVVKQTDTGVMYYVVDTSKLNSEDGYVEFTAGTATSVQWSGVTGKPTFANVATSGSYNDLSDKPTIPTVNNATLTIQKNGTNVQTFTANASSNVTANITVPTKTSDLDNDSNFITSSALPTNYVTTDTTQTISGAKTWTGNNTFKSANCNFEFQSTTAEAGSTTATSNWMRWQDKNGYQDAYISRDFWNDGGDTLRISISGKRSNGVPSTSGTDVECGVRLDITANGSKSVRPFVSGDTDLGTSSNQWKSVYSQSYFYNGVAWGLDKDNVWSANNEFKSILKLGNNGGIWFGNNQIEDITENPSSSLGKSILQIWNKTTTQYTGGIIDTLDTSGTHIIEIVNFGYPLNSTSSPYQHRFRFASKRDGTASFYPTYSNVELGTSSNKWNAVYANNYYLGTTAFGDIVTHNASEFLTSHQSLSNYVTLNGNQSISGQKTFTANQFFTSGIFQRNNNYTLGNTVTDNQVSTFAFADSANVAAGYCRSVIYKTSNMTSTEITARNKIKNGALDTTGDVVTAQFFVRVESNGNKYIAWDGSVKNNIIPYATNTYDLGSASNKWNAVYANSYYLGATPFGDIVTHNASEFLTSHQSLAGYLPLTGGTLTGGVAQKLTDYERGVSTTENTRSLIDIRDKNNMRFGLIETSVSEDKSSQTCIYAYKTTATSGANIGALGIGCDASGNVLTVAPTPSTSDNSTKIATTAFVKAQGYLTSHQSLANYVTLNGTQTISGLKTWTSYQTISGSYIGDEDSVNARTCLYLTSNRDTVGQSGIYVTKFRQNVSQGSLDSSHYQFLGFDVLENSVRTNNSFTIRYTGWANNVPSKVIIDSSIEDCSLGSSVRMWNSVYAKSFNDVNPGTLSLPDSSKYESIDTTGWDLTGNSNSYTPQYDGYIVAVIKDTAGNGIYIAQGNMRASATGAGVFSSLSGGLCCFLPVIAGTAVSIRLVASSIHTMRFIPCFGNV